MTFQKGHPGYKKKGTKHKVTLLKEERRALFDAKVSEKWERTIDELRPEYVADQFMGKPVERHEHTHEVKEPSPKVLEYMNAILNKRGNTGTD
jgi:hypothetical protein